MYLLYLIKINYWGFGIGEIHFPNLQSLSLDGNNIADPSPLSKVNFPLIQGLFLFNNKIENINF